MNRRYVLYVPASIAALFFLATTSYGVLLFASVIGVLVLGASVMAWTGVLSASERIASGAVRAWKAVVPAHVTSTLFRQ